MLTSPEVPDRAKHRHEDEGRDRLIPCAPDSTVASPTSPPPPHHRHRTPSRSGPHATTTPWIFRACHHPLRGHRGGHGGFAHRPYHRLGTTEDVATATGMMVPLYWNWSGPGLDDDHHDCCRRRRRCSEHQYQERYRRQYRGPSITNDSGADQTYHQESVRPVRPVTVFVKYCNRQC